MRAPTESRHPWLWFAALWCAGIIAALLLVYTVRWLVGVTHV
jgi:hypothetical protein